MNNCKIIAGDVIKVLKRLQPSSYSGCLCDPPYSLGFMGKAWDTFKSPINFQHWCTAWGKELLRILKPGAFALVYGGTRTYHRLACGLEDAGFEVRDVIQWNYASGFPKSLNISLSIVNRKGAKRKIISSRTSNRKSTPGRWASNVGGGMFKPGMSTATVSAPETDLAKLFDGYGTALKPSYEPILVLMKPVDKNYVHNALTHGIAGLNIDGCRIGTESRFNAASGSIGRGGKGFLHSGRPPEAEEYTGAQATGRWPANVMFDEEAARLLDQQSGKVKSSNLQEGDIRPTSGRSWKNKSTAGVCRIGYGDEGGASRFFFCEKSQSCERGSDKEKRNLFGDLLDAPNIHPTVKPIKMDEYLAKLILPPPGKEPRRLINPFTGSGSEIIAALKAGWDSVTGIEVSKEYIETSRIRIRKHTGNVCKMHGC